MGLFFLVLCFTADHAYAKIARLITFLRVIMEKELRQNKMGVKPVGRLLFGMSLPMVISMLVQALYNVVDSVFVARITDEALRQYGHESLFKFIKYLFVHEVGSGTGATNDALTAVGLAYPIQMLMIAVAVGTAVGMNSLISRRLGERRFDEANRAAANGLFLEFVSAIAFIILSFTIVTPFLKLFHPSETVLEYGRSYLVICMAFGMGLFIHLGLDRILQSMGKTNLTMIGQLAGAITNIILDPLFIFGYCGFPELGVAGAAVATVIGQWVSMFICMLLVFCGRHEVKVSFKKFRPEKGSVKEIYRVGAPSIVMQGIGSIMNTGMNFILARMFTDQIGVAVMNVYYKMQSIIFMPMFGITNASMSILAYNFGARNKKRLMRTWILTVIVCIVIMTLGFVCFQLFPAQIVSVFDSDGTLTGASVRAFRIISIHFPIAAVCIAAGTLFQATGRGMYSMIVSLMRQLFALLPAAAILAAVTRNVNAVWYAFLIAEVMSLMVSTICFIRLYKNDIKPLDNNA